MALFEGPVHPHEPGLHSFRDPLEAGIRSVEIGLRLSPCDAHIFFCCGLAGLAAYASRDYAEAASWERRAMGLNPRFVGNLRFLAASLTASGQFKEAHEVGHALLRVNPTHAFKDADKRRLFGEHLVLAGLPE